MCKKKVLLVEDNLDDIELTKRAFRKCKYSDDIKMEIVTDGAEAIEYFYGKEKKQDGNNPYLILLDLNLPKINGFQVLKKIKNDDKLKFIPIIVLTSSREKKDMIKSYELGANGYIQKPLDLPEFIETVHKIGEYWIKINQHPRIAAS